MVLNITSFTGQGVKDWLIQRITSVIVAVYSLFLLGYLLLHPHIEFADWQALFNQTGMRLFTFAALLSMVWHAWIGIWTVLTDYVKCPYLRLSLQSFVILFLILCMVWGVQILWSVTL